MINKIKTKCINCDEKLEFTNHPLPPNILGLPDRGEDIYVHRKCLTPMILGEHWGERNG